MNSLGNFPFNQAIALDGAEVVNMRINANGKSDLEIFNDSYFKYQYHDQKYLVTRFLANKSNDLPFNKPIILNEVEIRKYNINLRGKSTLKEFKGSYFECEYLAQNRYRITRLNKIKDEVILNRIDNHTVKKISRSNEELNILKNYNAKIFYTDKLDTPLGAGCQGMVWSQVSSNNMSVACKFNKTHEKEKLALRRLNKDQRLTSLKNIIEYATDAAKLPINPHILNFKGMIFSEELNQYGLIYEKIDGCSLESFLQSNDDHEGQKKITKVFKEITLGLQALNDAGMPHTDLLQPGYNVMVRYSDDTAVVVDIDNRIVADEYRKIDDATSMKQLAIITCRFLAKRRFNGSNHEDAIKFLLSSDYSEYFKLIMTKCLSSEIVSWDEVAHAMEAIPC